MVPADPWPRGKVTHAPSRGGAVSGPDCRRIIMSGGGGGASQGAGAPAGRVRQEKGDGVTHRCCKAFS